MREEIPRSPGVPPGPAGGSPQPCLVQMAACPAQPDSAAFNNHCKKG